MVEGVVRGLNATIFAYGATGRYEWTNTALVGNSNSPVKFPGPFYWQLKHILFCSEWRLSLCLTVTCPWWSTPTCMIFNIWYNCMEANQDLLWSKTTAVFAWRLSFGCVTFYCCVAFGCSLAAQLGIEIAPSLDDSGKTHTMAGTPEDPGLMVLSLQSIFALISKQEADYEFEVTCSYLEVYNEVDNIHISQYFRKQMFWFLILVEETFPHYTNLEMKPKFIWKLRIDNLDPSRLCSSICRRGWGRPIPLSETNKNKCPTIISLSWTYVLFFLLQVIYDLLERSSGHLELREDPDQGITVAGLKRIQVWLCSNPNSHREWTSGSALGIWSLHNC